MADVIKAEIKNNYFNFRENFDIFYLKINILNNLKYFSVFGRESIKSINYKKSNERKS